MPLADNLLALYRLEEASGTRADALGANDATQHGSPSGVTGKVGTAIQLVKASSQYLSHADSSQLSSGNSDFEITCWVKFNTLPSLDASPLVAKWQSGSYEYLLYYDNADSRIKFAITADGSAGTFAVVTLSSLGGPVTGVWYFLTAFHDASANLLGISFNANSPDTISWSTGIHDGTTEFRIGSSADASTQLLDGVIDEVALFRRVLGSSDRSSFYNSGAGRAYPWDSAGTASSSFGFSCNAIGTDPGACSASMTFAATMSATGGAATGGSMSAAWSMAMSATGSSIDAGSGSSAFVMSFTALGGSSAAGSSSLAIGFTFAAASEVAGEGTASLAIGFTFSAIGPIEPGTTAIGLTGLLDTLLHHASLDFEVRLFQTGTNPLDASSTISDIVEADFNGYLGQQGTLFPPASINLGGEAESDSTVYTFTQDADGVPEDVEGMYLSFFDPSSNEVLLHFKYFPTPITFAFLGDAVSFSVKAFLANG